MTLARVLITGGGGQLASDLEEQLSEQEQLSERAEVRALRAPARSDLDITDDASVDATFGDLRPDTVFNCAAFHNVDMCERMEDRSHMVNVRAVKRLSERCAAQGTKLVHLSTNYVFDGTAPNPYRENDLPSPRGVYAISKLAGEYQALAYAPGALVVRSAGLYGLHGSASKGGNFVTRAIGRAGEQGQLRMVADQRLTPTSTSDLAAALIEAVEVGASGVLHLTNSGECSWFEFTEAIMDLAGIEVPIEPVDTTIPPGAAARPLNGVLARTAADSTGLSSLRPWREALADYMERAGLASARAPSRQPS